MGKVKKTGLLRKITALMLICVLFVSVNSLTVFAATGSSTKTASQKMTVILSGGSTGNSTATTINFNSFPADAVITRLEVNTGTMTYSGAVLTNSLTISGNGRTETIPWNGQANKTLTTSHFLMAEANGIFTITFNATNLGSTLGTKSYKPKITIWWDDSF